MGHMFRIKYFYNSVLNHTCPSRTGDDASRSKEGEFLEPSGQFWDPPQTVSLF